MEEATIEKELIGTNLGRFRSPNREKPEYIFPCRTGRTREKGSGTPRSSLEFQGGARRTRTICPGTPGVWPGA